MTLLALPAQGSTAWYPWASSLQDAIVGGEAGAPPGWDVTADGSANLQWKVEGAGDWAAHLTTVGDFQIRGTLVGEGFINYGNSTTRIPFNNSVTVDGSSLSTFGNAADKVGMQNSVNFTGGFSGEVGYGASNPGFVWGANDFITSGTTTGDLAGITDLSARLTEIHMQAPGATVNMVTSLVAEANVNSVGGTVTGWLASLTARGPQNRSTPKATVAKATSLLVQSPPVNTATLQYALYVEGDGLSYLSGNIDMNGDPSAPKTINAFSGGFRGQALRIGAPGDTGAMTGAQMIVQSASTTLVPAWFRSRGSQTADIMKIGENDNVLWSRFDKLGRLGINTQYAPILSELNTGELILTVEPAAGAMKLRLTGKDAGGTLRSALVSLA